MSKLKYLTVLLILILSGFYGMRVLAQVAQDWVSFYDGPEHREDYPKAMTLDSDGNIYVTGFSDGLTTGYDYVTIKYNSSGDSVWVRRYNNALENGSDQANAIVVDDSGNVYVTGSSTGYGTYGDFFTIKYNSAGDELWTQRWDSDFHDGDGARDIVLDSFGNIFVTGSAYRGGNAWDAVTIKYNASGVEQWVSLYSGQLGDFDQAYSIVLDNSGNTYVAGRCGENGYGEYLTIKYDSNGDTLWTKKYDGPANGVDEAYSIALDQSGNAYVTGRSLGNTSGYDYATIKYNPSGDTVWVRRYNGTANDIDEAYVVAVDGSGNVYVTGVSNQLGSSLDYLTIKYNSSGVEQWAKNYNGPGYAFDYPHAIVLDDFGNVYVTGESPGGSPSYTDFATIKYNPDGNEQWVQRYNGTASSNDYGRSIAVDNLGNVYVIGESGGTGTEYDYVTIKYSQTPTGVYEIGNEIPENYQLHQNYPNPFNPSTTITCSIPNEEFVSLKVFNTLGEQVATLLNETKPAGNYSFTFDASELTSGVYFYRLQAGEFSKTKKLLLQK